MNNVLQQVEWESCLVEPSPDPALESYVRRRWGIPNPLITYFASVPWMARAVIDLHPEYGLLMHLDQAVADLVVLVVSQENSCRFCYAAVRALLWAQGMSWTRIQRMEQDLTRADLPPRTMAAVAFGRSQSRSGPAGARAARETLRRSGLGVDEMKEIAFTAALTDFNNRAHTIPAIPPYPTGREGLPLLALGIGIDRGLGLVGLVGSRERMEYDFVGRTVNVAARVQTLTRIHQADILVTEMLRAELDTR